MRNFIEQLLTDAAQNPKVAATVSTVTMTAGSGIGTYLNLIPNHIGTIASLLGAVLSIVLIVTHIKKFNRDKKKHDLEVEILERALTNSKERHGVNERSTD